MQHTYLLCSTFVLPVSFLFLLFSLSLSSHRIPRKVMHKVLPVKLLPWNIKLGSVHTYAHRHMTLHAYKCQDMSYQILLWSKILEGQFQACYICLSMSPVTLEITSFFFLFLSLYVGPKIIKNCTHMCTFFCFVSFSFWLILI